MPPHLHPRSSATTTLFASTLAASFIIVGIPHIFPCPAARRRDYLDSDGNLARRQKQKQQKQQQRRQRAAVVESAGSERGGSDKAWMEAEVERRERERDMETEEVREGFRALQEEEKRREEERKTCPMPRPRGWIWGLGRGGKEEG